MKIIDSIYKNIDEYAIYYKFFDNKHFFLCEKSISIFDSNFNLENSINFDQKISSCDNFAVSDNRILLLRNTSNQLITEEHDDDSFLQLFLIDFSCQVLATKTLQNSWGYDVTIHNDRLYVALTNYTSNTFEIMHFDNNFKDEIVVKVKSITDFDSSIVRASFCSNFLDLYFLDQVADLHFFSPETGYIVLNISNGDHFRLIKNIHCLSSFYFSNECKILNISFRDGILLGFKKDSGKTMSLEFDFSTNNVSHFQVFFYDRNSKIISLDHLGFSVLMQRNSVHFLSDFFI
jgi:hypothetical protein